MAKQWFDYKKLKLKAFHNDSDSRNDMNEFSTEESFTDLGLPINTWRKKSSL